MNILEKKVMKIALPEDFLLITKNKFLLLDTCVFIDAFSHPSEFANFFNQLKENKTALVTIDTVLFEFLKGSPNESKFNEKKKFLEDIVETFLPIRDFQTEVEKIIKEYNIESKDLSVTDLYLGATLTKYRKNLCLLTKDLSDFPSYIFERITFLNLLHSKAIHPYGVYCYK